MRRAIPLSHAGTTEKGRLLDSGPHISIPSFAKINWTLEVLGKRPDGFHEVRTLFQTIDLADEIEFERLEASQDSLQIEGRTCSPGGQNLVLKAVALMREETGFSGSVGAVLKKKVPVSAGLGGGSSNAAATLLAVNQLFNCGLDLASLSALGARIGSDVPFFLYGGTAYGTGRGEEIRSVAGPPEIGEILVAFPRLAVSAAEAYTELNARPLHEAMLTVQEGDTKIRRFLESRELQVLRNDLEPPVLQRYPAISRLKESLLGAGCSFAMLSGSGSSVFALAEPDVLRTAAKRCLDEGLWDVFTCRVLSRRDYLRRFISAGIDRAIWREQDILSV